MKKHIVFTGGGTAGHVTPNIALIEAFQEEGWKISYIGSKGGIEEGIITALQIPFYTIATGKFRRYWSFKNFLDIFRILQGIGQAYLLLRRLQATIVFSKGGFVAFPVVVAAFLRRIPSVTHESDMTPGLANRATFPFANKVCVNFSPTLLYCKHHPKVELTGTLLRSHLFQGDAKKALRICGFHEEKPCLLIVGGSLGAKILNDTIRQSLETITKKYQVIHLCGKGKIDPSLQNVKGYYQQEYAHAELADFFAASDIVISRAGANAVYEMLSLRKLHILIPLSTLYSRGDQIDNARYFEKQGTSVVIPEESLTLESLLAALDTTDLKRELLLQKMHDLNLPSGIRILEILKELSTMGIEENNIPANS